MAPRDTSKGQPWADSLGEEREEGPTEDRAAGEAGGGAGQDGLTAPAGKGHSGGRPGRTGPS